MLRTICTSVLTKSRVLGTSKNVSMLALRSKQAITSNTRHGLFFSIFGSQRFYSSDVNVREDIQKNLVAAMKAKDKNKVEAYRSIKNAIVYADKEGGKEIQGDEIMKVLKDLLGKSEEIRKEMASHNKADFVAEEEALINAIKQYLPKQLSTEELKAELQKIITEVGATAPKDLGKVIKAGLAKFGNQVSNKDLSDVAKTLLTPNK